MRGYLACFIVLALSTTAQAEAVDCQTNPTFLQKMPGGYRVVFSCGCEPPSLSSGQPDDYLCGLPPPPDPVTTTHYEPVPSGAAAADAATNRPAYISLQGLNRTNLGSSLSAISPSSGKRCVGECFGVPSRLTGNPRNIYVRGYTRKDGTYVRGHTRSRR